MEAVSLYQLLSGSVRDTLKLGGYLQSTLNWDLLTKTRAFEVIQGKLWS